MDEELHAAALSGDQERMLILGSALSCLLEEAPEDPLSKEILEHLDAVLMDSEERALFNFCPRLDYNAKLLPLKPPR